MKYKQQITVQRISQSWFLEKTDNSEKSLAKLTKRKIKKAKWVKVKLKKESFQQIQVKFRKLWGHTLLIYVPLNQNTQSNSSLDEWGLPKLNQDETENWSRSVRRSSIESAMKNHPTRLSGPNLSDLQGTLPPKLLKLLGKRGKKGRPSNPFRSLCLPGKWDQSHNENSLSFLPGEHRQPQNLGHRLCFPIRAREEDSFAEDTTLFGCINKST